MILNFSFDSSVSSAPVGFTAVLNSVASFFDSLFSDPVTINIAVGYGEVNNQPLPSGALGASSSRLSSYSYSQIRTAFAADAKSATDSSAVSSLPATDPTGGHYWVTTAEAKALGLLSGSSNDGSVGFNASAAFDYDLSNGVTSGQYDFFGVVAHEVSEILGRQLLVGETIGSTPNGYEPMDLLHFASPGVRTFLGTQTGYFSPDNGTTNLNNFNTNPSGDFGDWAASAGNDSANAFGFPGVINAFSQADIKVMDAIGWDLASDTTPPVVSGTNPADNSTNVAVGSNLVLTFNESVKAGSGNLVIHKTSDGSAVASIAITDSSQVNFSGSTVTINPSSNLAAGTHYYVTIASGVIQDLAGNAYAGISSSTAFDFTTTPMTPIESIGATTLAQSGNQFYLLDSTSGVGPLLTFNGIDSLADRWAGWVPIGAEKIASGYEVAWKGPGALYEVWNTDNSGAFISQPIGDVLGSNPALQAAETSFQQDLNGDGHIGSGTTTTPIESIGATTLAQSGNQFYLLDSSSGSGPTLTYHGSDALADRWAGWAPIGAEKIASGYEVAWKGPGALYEVWNTDNSGAFISQPIGDVPGSNPALQAAETSFQQDLNDDGHIGTGTTTTPIESIGATTLAQSGNQFYLLDSSSGSGPTLTYHGSDALADRWAGWAPIGAEKTASGYEVAWKGPGALYEVWNTDNSGSFISQPIGDVPGSNPALQAAETSFQQDLNGDGHIGTGTTTTPIESIGATTLAQSGNQFYLLDSTSGSGPLLTFHGIDSLADRWAGWAPIGAEKIASGYEVAWKGPGALYEVWNTDNSGSFISQPIGDVPGSDPALQAAETSFQQDLNGDGHIGTLGGQMAAANVPTPSGNILQNDAHHDWLL